MLTYSFENKGNESLYEYLYKRIKADILSETICAGEKLPSKRALAKHLNISVITIENAYNQLMAEGYLYSVPKSGFYVSDISSLKPLAAKRPAHTSSQPKYTVAKSRDSFSQKHLADFTNNSTLPETFPFSTWSKLTRLTMADYAKDLMMRSPSGGILLLREAIADYLYQFRGILVEPEQIIVGAGTEYLYSILIQLLGRDKIYAVEDPGYQKITHIYEANSVSCVHVPLDKNGVSVSSLADTGADILHISPSHHFPTGIVTPISRRYELLAWASETSGRYIIEDDYDSEFRLTGKPIPSLQSIDSAGKVIYMNTFSKSLSSTIRISYMVLPNTLAEKYHRELNFYACTVSNFDQYTLYQFIKQGYLEKHINRMRNYYRVQRDILLDCMRKQPYFDKVKIKEEHAGLHFLLEVDTKYSDEDLVKQIAQKGIHISCLSEYYYDKRKAQKHTLIINYSGMEPEQLEEAVDRLFDGIFE